jgi:hypothetical protein
MHKVHHFVMVEEQESKWKNSNLSLLVSKPKSLAQKSGALPLDHQVSTQVLRMMHLPSGCCFDRQVFLHATADVRLW